MSKTRNAFALRDFDTERILQRKFFLHRLGVVHEYTTINDVTYKDTDADTLDLNDARNVAHLGSAEMVERLSDLQKLETAVAAYKKLLEVHTTRLESLCTKYAKKFAETAEQLWQEKYRRAQNLQQSYTDATAKIFILQERITELERAGEKSIDQQRRKEFAARLQDARQKAGLRQSDLANKIKISTATIASYEQALSAPQIPMLIRICHALNCSADELLDLKN